MNMWPAAESCSYVYSRHICRHITTDMCILGKDTQNIEALYIDAICKVIYDIQTSFLALFVPLSTEFEMQ